MADRRPLGRPEGATSGAPTAASGFAGAADLNPSHDPKGDQTLTAPLYRFTGLLPDLNRIYDPALALPSDGDWLRDNPEAVARVRTFRDDARTDKRVILLTVRQADPSVPEGWRPAYVEGHPAHWGGPAFTAWQDNPGDVMAANAFALHVLAADADVDAGHALTALGGLALPDPSELPAHWRGQFAPIAARSAA